ncbi:MAG: RidA family protein [Promethearchaeota archaeon]
MKKEIIQPEPAPPSPAPFSPGIKIGNMVYTSGQVGIDPKTGKIPIKVGEQTKICLERIKIILEEAGSSLDNVVKTTVFLSDIRYFSDMNEVYVTFFPRDRPARSTVEARLAFPHLMVELEVIAHI